MKISQIATRSLCLLGLWLGLGPQVHAQTDTVTYVYTDPQGTPLVEADASGNVIARYDYTPYGSSVTSLGNPPNGPGYTGHVNDPETGLVYMQARYYQPLGRFLSPDPVGPVVGNVYNFNRYGYANNNPIVNADPDGRETGIAFHAEWVADGGHVVPTSPNDKLAAPLMYAMGGLAVAAGGGEIIGMVRAAITIDKALSNSSSGSKSIGGIKVGNTPSTARQALTDAGHPGDPITNPQGTEHGTIHTIADKKMDVRIMDGNANNAPRAVTNRTGNPKQLVDPNTGKNFGNNISKAEQRDRAHVPLDHQ